MSGLYRFLWFMLCIGITLLLLFTIFVGVRVDESINSNWCALFTPVWVAMAIAVTALTGGSCYVLLDTGQYSKDRLIFAVFVLIIFGVLVPFFFFELNLCRKLQQGVESKTSWSSVFIPLIIAEGCALLGALLKPRLEQ